jgi:hypothetical protein
MGRKKRKDHKDRLETAVKISMLVLAAIELARFILDYLVR